MTSRLGTLLLVLAASAATACKAAPRERPINMGPVDTGAGSLEATRRQLEGRWELVSLETYPQPGTAVPVKASGTLTYDAFGNVTIAGRVEDPTPGASGVLSYSGVIAIDVVKKEWRLTRVESTPEATAPLPAGTDVDKVRKYELAGDRLKTSMIDGSGRVTATATWKKAEGGTEPP